MSIPGSYIVVFKDNATPEQIKKYQDQVKSTGGEVTQEHSLIKGFSGKLTQSQLTSLQGDDIIKYIEEDQVVTTQ